MSSPFSKENLQEIFKIYTNNPRRLVSRESSCLEFKESFNYGSCDKYAKTMASFANNRGGYIVFGVKDKPKDVIGLKDNTFENMEPTKLTNVLNSTFSPEIKWDCYLHDFNGVKTGLIYTYESKQKPIVCKNNSSNVLKEGSIYYRYQGSSEVIKYSELIHILEKERIKERRQWFRMLTKINAAGIENVSLLNLQSGEITGPVGNYYINEEFLPDLTFIKEGEFSETEGAPTLRMLGDAKPINMVGTKREFIHKHINTLEVILSFLNQAKVSNPFEYIYAICEEPTGNYPIYYYIRQTEFDIPEILNRLESFDCRGQGKKMLIDRLNKDKNFNKGKMDNQIKDFYNKISAKTLPESISDDNLKYFFQAVTHLSVKKLDKDYLFNYLKSIYQNKFYEQLPSLDITNMRFAVAHLDQILYQSEILARDL